MEINLLISELIAGGLVLLSFLMLSNAIKVNRKPNIYFGICLFIWSSFWWDEVLFRDLLAQDYAVFAGIRFMQFLTPLVFYLSVLFYSNPYYKYSAKDSGHCILPLLFLFLLLCKPVVGESLFQGLYLFFVLGNSLVYITLAYFKIQRHRKNIEGFASNKENIDLNWIRYIIYAFIAASVIAAFYNIFTTQKSLNIYINLFFLVVVYLVAFHTVRQKEIYPKGLRIEDVIAESDETGTNSKNKLVDDAELEELKIKLTILMEKDKPYLDNDLNLVRLAEKMCISGHQLSYVINQGFEENFFYFVNKYRVKKAMELLKNSEYDKLTILAIGFESGFNSKTSFNTAFKKITTFTPTDYRKNRSDL
ncbi:helix-turn-helix domain-containing protein [Elizabethkingia meningoseptica]|uniref:helix-turn-helix domain-containing protein n=1 Tax=Elizabethkingia meningoseptica TaxID=238 RepID=UPI0009991730|nr:helix-turn-helix domain-containing protein [Elizabethkingia meningoseptica]MDE5466991.1 helix-turn-helix domain-containing protein [Elizabethkingia meningoseptica]MDE5473779.1 helix-turn-helix domain-containing protein [Elizabethkingia meningoseptica]MDE5477212.1 helix-turn-helix domain-containing protein [Elizabethkingia meningoseptica]MDE5484310.1 helix-turn-helix domain-containing protein [Elizabethkingia meningoseptica]MDE5500612.1 helix-turn-helix domain-containing protein [Elizabethki